MEQAKSITNPMLVGAIELMKAENTLEHRNLFIGEMIKAKFLAPVVLDPEPIPDENGAVKLTAENKIQLPMLTAPDGNHYFMAFSDMQELQLWKKEEKQNVFALTFQDYVKMVLRPDNNSAGFVINPYGANLVISKQMLEAIENMPQNPS